MPLISSVGILTSFCPMLHYIPRCSAVSSASPVPHIPARSLAGMEAMCETFREKLAQEAKWLKWSWYLLNTCCALCERSCGSIYTVKALWHACWLSLGWSLHSRFKFKLSFWSERETAYLQNAECGSLGQRNWVHGLSVVWLQNLAS